MYSGRLVDNPAALAEVCAHLRSAGVFGFDTEFVCRSTYHAVLCLVQVSTTERVELIDPLALKDLALFWELLADPAIEKICHAGDQDLALAWQLGGKKPQNVFDCQIGAGLVGIGYQESYARLVEFVGGPELAKAHTQSDWARRPLSKAQVSYGVDDVRYLPEIRRVLQERLEGLGRMNWMREACDELCVRAVAEQDPDAGLVKIKGQSRLGSRQLAVLRELWVLREQMASARNIPVQWMLKDETLVGLALRGPETPEALAAVSGVTSKLINSHGSRIIDAIRQGMSLPPAQCPPVRPSMTDETRRLVDIMYPASQMICLGQSVSPGLVANKEQIERLARLVAQGEDLSGHALMSGWARECLGEPLVEFVKGKTDVTLRVTPERVQAEFEPRE